MTTGRLVWTAAVLVFLAAGTAQGEPEKQPGAKEAVEQELRRLQGTWVMVGGWYASEALEEGFFDGTDEGSKVNKWVFDGTKVRFALGALGAESAGEYRIDPAKSPKHLDLDLDRIPGTGRKARIVWKSIYVLNGDELSIAVGLDANFAKPAEEVRRAKKAAATRPKHFEPREDELVMILNLRREKK